MKISEKEKEEEEEEEEEEEKLTVNGGVRREVGILYLASAIAGILHRKEDEKKRGK